MSNIFDMPISPKQKKRGYGQIRRLLARICVRHTLIPFCDFLAIQGKFEPRFSNIRSSLSAHTYKRMYCHLVIANRPHANIIVLSLLSRQVPTQRIAHVGALL